MTGLTRVQAVALAALVHELRPGWDEAGVMAALAEARHRGTAWDVTHAALYAAEVTTNRTPAVITHGGPHWTRGHRLGDRSAVLGAGDERCSDHPWHRRTGCSACRSESLARPDDAPEPAPDPDRTEIYARGRRLIDAARLAAVAQDRPLGLPAHQPRGGSTTR